MDRHYSEDCKANGSGQCDGYDYDHFSAPCDCACHYDHNFGVLPNTIEGVKDWHDEHWQVGKYASEAV